MEARERTGALVDGVVFGGRRPFLVVGGVLDDLAKDGGRYIRQRDPVRHLVANICGAGLMECEWWRGKGRVELGWWGEGTQGAPAIMFLIVIDACRKKGRFSAAEETAIATATIDMAGKRETHGGRNAAAN